MARGGHVAGQLLALLLGEGHDGLLKLDLAALAGPQRRGHYAIQMRQTQEGRQQTHTAGPLEAKDQMSGRAELVDEGQPGGGFEEGRADGVVGDGVLGVWPSTGVWSGADLARGRTADRRCRYCVVVGESRRERRRPQRVRGVGVAEWVCGVVDWSSTVQLRGGKFR